jgi:hypothetical protein
VLDQKAQKLLRKTMEAHAEANALERHVSDVSWQELAVAGQEQELQEKEEESSRKIECESSELQPCANDLSTREVIMEVEWERGRQGRTSSPTSSPSLCKKVAWSVAPLP